MNNRLVDLNLLRIFDAVMLERSMTRAAARLNMTQPAVSNAVNRLRDILKDDLFLKVAGGVSPSAKAEVIWPTVRVSIQKLSDTLDPSNFDPMTADMSFRLAMSDYVVDNLIRPIANELSIAAPGISIQLSPHTIENAVPLLAAGSIDMAAGVLANSSPRIHSLCLQPVTYVCAMRKGHELSKRPLSLKAFTSAKHMQISLSGEKSLVDRTLQDRGLRRNIVLTINHFALAPGILIETDLIAILPRATVEKSAYRQHLHVAQPPIPVADNSISLLWHDRSENMPAHQWLRSKLAELCPLEPAGR